MAPWLLEVQLRVCVCSFVRMSTGGESVRLVRKNWVDHVSCW